MKILVRLLVAAMLFATVGLFGCGDDGSDGVSGASAYEIAVANGFTGTEQEWLDSLQGAATFTANPAESCVVCHGTTGIAVVQEVHTTGVGDLAVNNIVVTPVAGDLVVTFSVTFNGADKPGFINLTRDYRFDGPTGNRQDLSTDGTPATLTSVLVTDPVTDEDSTLYTITIAGGDTANGAINSRYLFRIEDPTLTSADGERRAIVMFDYPASPVVDVLGDVSCANCHGSLGEGFHYGYPANGGKTCVVCHDAANTTYPRLYSMIHGIHNSAKMPTGTFPLFDNSVPPEFIQDFSVGFPSYMNNCSICHTTDAVLAVINAEPVTYEFCMTCHQNFDGFGAVDFGGVSHAAFTAATNCAVCHDGATAPATHAAIHNAQELTTERGGLIWDGYDASVREGARIDAQFSGVTRTGDDLAISWTATIDGNPVDPCNTVAGTDAPTWQSGFSILKAFFQGDDLVNANNGNSAPGQANSTNLDFTAVTGNTVCVANEATTTITLTAEEALLTGKARIGLQGRPTLTFAPASLPAGTNMLVRAKSPVYDFDVASGAPATPRRVVVNNDLCIGCHVGSLYQHGGNRIDNEELCIMCHNEASSEQNVRVGYGVDATEAYDGKAGQTYGFKTLLHAVHATGTTGAPIVIYRTRGIYAFAGSEASLQNWPGTGTQTIFGSDPPATQTHNFVTAHFPRRINDCAACHVDDFTRMPNPTVSMATTVEAGVAPYDNQLDDGLEGPTAAACMSCHQSTVGFEQSALKNHAYSNGWVPQVFLKGRQTIIESNQ